MPEESQIGWPTLDSLAKLLTKEGGVKAGLSVCLTRLNHAHDTLQEIFDELHLYRDNDQPVCSFSYEEKLVHAAYEYTSAVRTHEGPGARGPAGQQPKGTTLQQVGGVSSSRQKFIRPLIF